MRHIFVRVFVYFGVVIVAFTFLIGLMYTQFNQSNIVGTYRTQLTDLAKDTDVLINENEEAIKVALDNFNSVDFESLNHSISSLAEIMEPVVEIVKILRE